jgi:ATP adenylyltransferase
VIENLWAGWRARYLSDLASRSNPDSQVVTDSATGAVTPVSVFRSILESGSSDEATFIVARRQRVFVILNAYPYAVGHTMIVPYRQVADLDDLDPEESSELWTTVTDVCRAIRAEFAPHGLNVGINMGAASGGSINEHLHVHVVPRWMGDSNFLTTTANAKAMPEALDVTAARLRRALLDS